MAIEGVGAVPAIGAEEPRAAQNAQAVKEAESLMAARGEAVQSAAEVYLKGLAQQYPEAKLSMGDGFDGLSDAALAKLGKGNVMIAPAMAAKLAEKSDDTEQYGKALDTLLTSFDSLFANAGGNPENLTSWGSFLGEDGLFDTWGISDPFSEDSIFEAIDAGIFASMSKIGRRTDNERLNADRDFLRYEQNMEQIELRLQKQGGTARAALGEQEKTGAISAAIAEYERMEQETTPPIDGGGHHLNTVD